MLPDNTESSTLATGDVFISYRHCNADLVAPVEAELHRRGISYFIDRVGVNYGKYSKAITKAISDCKLLLLLWTADVKESDDIVNEVVLALKLKKTVIPYKIGDFNELEHPEMCYHLASLSRYEVPRQTPETVVEIVDRIEQVLTDNPLMSEPHQPQKKTHKTFFVLLAFLVLLGLIFYSQLEIFKPKPEPEPPKPEPDPPMSITETKPITETIPKLHEGTIAGEREVITINDEKFAFRWCPPGTFKMGSPESEEKRWRYEKQHQVTLTKGFWMMETEVSQKQWVKVMGKNPSYFIGENLPVEQVSWKDCQNFCINCSLLGMSVQLPTEAQWEYACRAGSSTAFSWGNELNGDKANCAGNCPYGTKIKGEYLQKTMPVGSYSPNAWGLYDMHGNVREWCADWYGDYPSGNVTDPTGPSNGSYRVYRGGSWYDRAKYCRSAYRYDKSENFKHKTLGFRCVITPK